jgi:hypothetical protein
MMNSGQIKDILNWDHDKELVCRQISNHFAPIKILLKTKNEPERLKEWIVHHSNSVGTENLVIFDNMSTKSAVFEVYRRFAATSIVAQFSGFQDRIHHTDYFSELYDALRKSCDYFIFLDTDEYLALYDGEDRFYFDIESIRSFVADRKDILVFPGTWLQNLAGFNDRFMLQGRPGPLIGDLAWGKPLIASCCKASGIILHNTQLKSFLSGSSLITNFFVLHRTNVSSSERIAANLEKLISAGLLRPTDGLDELLRVDIEQLPDGNQKRYCLEVRAILAAGAQAPRSTAGSFALGEDGVANWSYDWQRVLMREFVREPYRFSDLLFST